MVRIAASLTPRLATSAQWRHRSFQRAARHREAMRRCQILANKIPVAAVAAQPLRLPALRLRQAPLPGRPPTAHPTSRPDITPHRVAGAAISAAMRLLSHSSRYTWSIGVASSSVSITPPFRVVLGRASSNPHDPRAPDDQRVSWSSGQRVSFPRRMTPRDCRARLPPALTGWDQARARRARPRLFA